MKIEQARELANAVLYEGYLLYPYRQSAIKNRRRWTFGVVYPRAYSQASGEIEPWVMQTECLVAGTPDAHLDVYVRFLHLLVRSVEQPESSNPAAPVQEGASEWSVAARMANEPWEEGVEREVSALNLSLRDLLAQPVEVEITVPGGRLVNEVVGAGAVAEVREQQPLAGIVRIAAGPVGEDVYRLRIQIENHTLTGSLESQYAVMRHSFVSTHTLLQVRQGSFVSLMDPPPALRAAAQECQNRHTWPVLAGTAGELDAMLSSPIILYDYPQIAPESPGPLFDGTEIDEILTLRIMTLSDDEKEEIRRGDERAREILERTESLTPEQFMQLHGTMRSSQNPPSEPAAAQYTPPAPDAQFGIPEIGMQFSAPNADSQHSGEYPGEDYLPPTSIQIDGREVWAGSHVRLHPQVRSDVFDLLLAGKTARVEAIQQDFENRVYLVVTVDDDPGRVQWDERVMPGHRFYFFPQEVELLDEKEEALGREP